MRDYRDLRQRSIAALVESDPVWMIAWSLGTRSLREVCHRKGVSSQGSVVVLEHGKPASAPEVGCPFRVVELAQLCEPMGGSQQHGQLVLAEDGLWPRGYFLAVELAGAKAR